MNAKLCPDCFTLCTSHAICLKMQDFNLIVEQAKAIAKLKKTIQKTTPHFKGIKSWLRNEVEDQFENIEFSDSTPIYTRFITITFDPRKFTFNELTQPKLLINYIKNALLDLKNLFKQKPICIIEYMKSGVVHAHVNYECSSVLESTTLLLRLKYFFSDSLRNRNAIHDRYFNEGGNVYLRKSNTHYFTFKEQ